MIPTLLVPALLVGRWWFVALAAAAWPAVLVLAGDCDHACLPAGALFRAVNAAIGVAMHKLVLAMVRALRSYALRS